MVHWYINRGKWILVEVSRTRKLAECGKAIESGDSTGEGIFVLKKCELTIKKLSS